MSNTWKEGKIAYSPNIIQNRSKQEKQFIELLTNELNGEKILTEQTLHDNDKYFFPDAILPVKPIFFIMFLILFIFL